MVMRQMVTYPNEILRKKTPVIMKVDDELLKDIESLKEVLLSEKQHAAGLAAPQIGISKRFFGGLMERSKNKVRIYINPKVEKTFGEKVKPMMVFEDGKEEPFWEGCLSFPNLFGQVKRYLKIEASWKEIINGKLETKNEKLEGILAIVFQHESEHLEGILFVDHLKKEGGEMVKIVEGKEIKWEVEKV